MPNTVSGSDWRVDQDAIETFVNEAPRELLQLEHWGCPWSRQPNGRVAVRAFGGMKRMRTWFAPDKTGFHMLHALFQTSLKYVSGGGVTAAMFLPVLVFLFALAFPLGRIDPPSGSTCATSCTAR